MNSVMNLVAPHVGAPPTPLTLAWVRRIHGVWQQSVEAIIETGRLLRDAKDALPHGEFLAMIKSQLPFEARAAQMLMKVGADERIRNTVSHLPPHWGTLYELTKLPDEQFRARLEDGTIRPDMQRRDIAQVVKRERRIERERALGARQIALPQKKYGVILADPEWKFTPRSEVTGMDRAAANHYPTSETEAIAARDVASIAADDCVLFLWATAPMLVHALSVMGCWGFEYKTHAVWNKIRTGAARGTGYWFTGEHEPLLIGTRGHVVAPATAIGPSVIEAPWQGRHSAKPELFAEMIERQFPSLPKIEMNRRGAARPGWDAWGFDVESQAEAAA